MADEVTPTPSATPTPAAAPAPAPVAAPAAAPVAAAPISNEQMLANAQQDFAVRDQHYAAASALATPPPAPAPVPHARLLAMIQGIGIGLSSFGTAMGTGGREGGAPEVQQFYARQQEQKLQAQQAAQAQRNQLMQNQITAGDTNGKMGTSWMLLAQTRSELEQKDLERKSTTVGIIGQIQDVRTKAMQDYLATGDKKAFDSTKAQLDGVGSSAAAGAAPSAGVPSPGAAAPSAGAPAPAGAPTASASGDIPPVAASFWKNATDAASAAFPNDPDIKNAAAVIANPDSDSVARAAAARLATVRMDALNKGVESQTKQAALTKATQDNNPLFKYQSDPKALADPGAQQTLQAYIDNPANKGNLDGLSQAKLLIKKADIAQQHAIALDAEKARQNKNAEMAASAGDPKQAGQLLAEGSLTLADLKSRGSSPSQIIAATNAAKDYAKAHGTTYNASDEVTGEQALKGVSNQTFYGSARSLVQQGGMLDQLKAAHEALGNQRVPVLNTITDWINFQAGTPELAAYKQAVLAAADDYAKVMGGGSPNLEQFKSIRDGFANNLGNKAFDDAVGIARNSVRSQVGGRIGTNSYIKQREGDILIDAPKAAPSGKAVSLAAARALPINKGKTDDEIRADILAHGHQVSQ